MKITFLIKGIIWNFAVILFAISGAQTSQAVPIVSNLADQFTGGGIGDIHGLYPGGAPYGSDSANFSTGAAGNYALNTITLEFLTGSGTPAGWNQGWNNLNIQLYQNTPGGSVLLGSLGHPVIDSTPTQWPQSSGNSIYTTYVDFSPFQNITLSALTHYSLVLSVPSTKTTGASLLFATSSTYVTPTDWTMSATISGNPYANGEYLKLAVDASPVPDQINTAFLLIGVLAISIGLNRAWKSKFAPPESPKCCYQSVSR